MFRARVKDRYECGGMGRGDEERNWTVRAGFYYHLVSRYYGQLRLPRNSPPSVSTQPQNDRRLPE